MKDQYWLINTEDLVRYATEEQKYQLGQILQEIVDGRKNDGKKDRYNLFDANQLTLIKGKELFQ